jgi:hypothetical protein
MTSVVRSRSTSVKETVGGREVFIEYTKQEDLVIGISTE